MKILGIKYKKKTGAPKAVTVELTIDEIACLDRVFGKFSHEKFVAHTGSDRFVDNDFYWLACEVFNRHWDDGADDYLAGKTPAESRGI